MSPPSKTRSSLSPNPPGPASTRTWRGRTPPPAPSASFARRARQIIEDETGVTAMKPVDMDEGDLQGSKHVDVGYRRARAGTLPSKFQEVSERYSSPEEPDIPISASTPYTTPARTSGLTPAYPTTPSTRPTLRHTISSAASLETPTSASRLRSGSLTLPKNGLSSAFGSSPFSNAWLAHPSLNVVQARSPLRHSDGDPMPHTLPSDPILSLANDGLNPSILAHLGLNDEADGQPAPASLSELRSQAQRAIANSGPASRLRASTISNYARPFRPSVTNANPYLSDQNASSGRQEEEALAIAIENLGLYDPSLSINSQLANLYAPSSLFNKDSNRPRATTIGALDNPLRRNGQAHHGYLASIPQSPNPGQLAHPMIPNGSYGYAPRSSADRDFIRSRDSSTSHGPRLSISSHTSRAGTPDIGGSSTPQMPTRSLWIGNLDVNATNDALLHVFAPYGAIDSVRMLPEKTCAFVNFMEKSDAIRARDEVLNRMGGHVTALSGTAPVRIGFGKIDSVPIIASAPLPAHVTISNGQYGGVPALWQSLDTIRSTDNGAEQSSSPTRALWVGSIPSTTSSSALLQIFSPFGPIESARVLMHKCCGFVNFEHLDAAVSARNALNGRDLLGSDVGPIRIGFARVPTKSANIGGSDDDPVDDSQTQALEERLSTIQGATAVSTEHQLSVDGGGVENYRSQLVLDLVKAGVHEQVLQKGLAHDGLVTEQQMIMQILSSGSEEDEDIRAAAEPRAMTTYFTSIPVIGDRFARRFDSARLKDLRKRLDSGSCSEDDVATITHDLLDESAELASDYIGNTVIQKLFEHTSPALRLAMLERIAPHLAMIGVHKNGTWAAQKIIECSVTDTERELVAANLRAYAPPLMCDSLGNYVCAGTLRFGEPFNGYVYDAIVDRMWDIAQNRFGARCMRTCLESPHTSLYQRKRISSAIILNSIPLATNPNGALLLTWLVDQSNLPGRYGLLANRFATHIAHLCTHKLASLTVLRIITQTSEAPASSTLISSIFFSPNDSTLTEILADANNGSQVIGKILAITSLSSDDRNMITEAIRRVLPGIRASFTPPYRLLLEAVGLPVPAGHIGASPFSHAAASGQGHGRGQEHWQQNYYAYRQPMGGSTDYPNHNLSPLLIPQTMPIGQSLRAGSPNPNVGVDGSPRTPQPRHRSRLSPQSQMMSPGSDPFNPFASPSIDIPYHQSHAGMRLASSLSQPPVAFDPQPNLGGLGMGPLQQHHVSPEQQIYYRNMMRQGLYAQAGYQA